MNRHAQIAANQHDPDAVSDATYASAYKLLDSANTASASARNAWLAFLILLAYLMVTVSGVTHVDLLLNSAVILPIANVEVPLFSFF